MNKMNQTQTRSPRKRLLSLILAVILMIGLLPISAFATSASAQAGEDKAATQDSEFLRIFHLDCGRKYFTVSEIEGIIDQLAENHFTHLQLAFGNNGFRFLLNDMSVKANNKTYSSDDVKNAVTNGNATYSNGKNTASTMLSETDMDTIIAYAKGKDISIIPMLNTPGHMDALVSAMNELGVGTQRTDSEMSLTSDAQVEFIKAFQQKYITYFASKGSEYYNLAADEYSFSGLSDTEYTAFAKYVNEVAKMVKDAKMTPLAYNDGFLYSGKTSSVPFDTDIVICYWAQGTNYASVTELHNAGFKILNNNDAWYYVLGDYLYDIWSKGQWGYEDALKGIKSTPVTQAKNVADKEIPVAGSVLCCWCDGPSKSWADSKDNVYDLIATMAKYNPDYFTGKVKLSASDDNTGVSVAVTGAKGQKATVEVKKITSEFPFDTEAHVSYSVTPAVDGKAYTGEGTVTLPVPADWVTEASRIRAYIIDNGAVKLISGTLSDGKYTFQVPHFSEMGLVQLAKGAGSTENVTVAVDRTSKAYDLTGDNLPGDGTYKTDDGIASYTIATSTGKMTATKATSIDSKTEYIIGNGSQYLKLSDSITPTTNLADATKWTISSSGNGYTIKSDSYYLSYSYDYWSGYSLSASTSEATWSWSANDGFYFTSGRYTYYLTYSTYSDGWTVSSRSSAKGGGQPYTVTEVPGGKTVTFKGVAVGNTTAVIGDTQYNITVVNEELDNAATLPIQLWITNASIEVNDVTTRGSGQFNDYNNGGYAYYVTAEAEDAYGKDGVSLATLVPSAVKNKTVTSSNDRNATYVLWKGTVLNTQTGLQKVWWKDMTQADGRVDYQFVRYFDGKWAVSNDRANWTTVTGEGSTGASSGCKEQVIAYYMQRTDVTKEVITDVVDWGNTTDKWAAQSPTQYGVLDFAVVYPNGTKVPSTFPEDGKTVFFHCNESDNTGAVHKDDDNNYYRRIGQINGIDTTGYEIYMITVTPTSDIVTEQLTNSTTALTKDTVIKYGGTEKVAWIDNEDNLPSQFKGADAKYSSISGKFNYTVGGNPNVAGLEIYQRQGMLVTYYIRPIVTTDSLTVHYIDKNADKEFYTYPINVIKGTYFNGNINLDNPWKGPLANGTVKNDQNVDQTVSADLSTMPAIGAQYRFSNYTCEEVRPSDDLKDVYLYYTFTAEKTFVVDFGLPLNIKPTDVSENLRTANITSVQVNNSYYATVTPKADFSVDYQLTKIMNGSDNVIVSYLGNNVTTMEDGSATFNLTIIPASNVYYEDSLAAFTDGSGAAQNAVWSIVGNDGNAATEKTGVYQALQELGKGNNRTPYGYDDKYNKENSSMLSMGTAHKVTVTAAMANAWTKDDTASAWPTAQFTFKGTGFDIISLTNNKSGAIFVDVYKAGEEKPTYSYIVDNYYGYNYNKETGKWDVVNSGTENALYQIPVMKVTGLDYGEYNAVVTVFYDGLFNQTKDSQYSFWLDAVRIYDPMGEYADYTKDNEGYPQYIKLRDTLAKSTIGTTLFIDGKDSATIAEYANYGPNNEVYLMNGQAITFKIPQNANVDSIQIGAKAPDGKPAQMVVNKDNPVEISTATEMYYKINVNVSAADQTVVIANKDGTGILSLTNLKITFKNKPTDKITLTALNNQEQENAVSLVRALFTAPVATFSPETFEADWGRAVRAGKKATLTVKTSADVESITVDGQSITRYTTRTQRTGWGWWSPKVTYHVFTYTITAPAQTTDYAVCAVNAEGTASEAVTATLTVKPTTWWSWWF